MTRIRVRILNRARGVNRETRTKRSERLTLAPDVIVFRVGIPDQKSVNDWVNPVAEWMEK